MGLITSAHYPSLTLLTTVSETGTLAAIEVTKEMNDYVRRACAAYERSKEKDRIDRWDSWKRALAKKRITEEIKKLEAKRAEVAKEANAEQNLFNEK